MPESPLDVDTSVEARAAATRRAQVKLEFLRHVLVYTVVIAALFVINLLTSPGYFWFVWPAAGWGIGLLVHATNVFIFTDRLEQRLAKHELRRAQRSH